MKKLGVPVLLLVLSGCASAPLSAPLIHRKVGESPALRAASEREVGEVIYETFDYEEWQGAQLAEPLRISVLAAQATINPGDALIAVEEKGATVYCTAKPTLQVVNQAPSSRVCLADRNQDQRFEEWRAPEGPPARINWAPLKVAVSFSTGSKMAPTGNGYRYELLYQGLSGNVVRLLYREYVDDLIRPAFQQDLSYTLASSGPTEISFRGTKIVIESADNNRIRYEVLSSLKPR